MGKVMEIVEGSRWEVAYQLRKLGWTYAAIAKEFGVTGSCVRQACLREERKIQYRKSRKLLLATDELYDRAELRFLSNYFDQIKSLTEK